MKNLKNNIDDKYFKVEYDFADISEITINDNFLENFNLSDLVI